MIPVPPGSMLLHRDGYALYWVWAYYDGLAFITALGEEGMWWDNITVGYLELIASRSRRVG